MALLSMKSFFDKNYKTPVFLKEKQLSRRALLKSAAGMGVVSAIPSFSLSAKQQKSLVQLAKTEPWLTLNATLKQLLPESATGPSAEDINALAYLHQVMTVQPTEQEEKDFILKGVGWLNGYANSEKDKNFVELTFNEKEQLLKGISKSRAGENWINTLLGYILQAMLAPPSYGGNTKGIGWQWLEHKAGFPLPEKGQRYFELPKRASIIKLTRLSHQENK
jgi:gluconate 2-dehydrogenase gamma chain